MEKWLVGVDEAGRGPLAGPVAVGVVKVSHDFDWELIPGVDDSKRLNEAKREVVFQAARRLLAAGQLTYAVAMSGSKVIDKKGIVPAIQKAQMRAFKSLSLMPEECFIKLDGGLTAPVEFQQETIIKGDSKEKVIGLASIMAKVTRDRYMRRIAKQFAAYQFDIHKGYGTKTHREAVLEYGVCEIHRLSFCQKLTNQK